MNREEVLKGSLSKELFEAMHGLKEHLDQAFQTQFQRSLPFADEVFDRWERAAKLGFGKGSSIYDSSYVFGQIQVGENTWIGPFTIIDGSGGLSIGCNCTISAGVHLYSHDNVRQTLTGGKAPIERQSVQIGNNTYLGPNVIVKKGVSIGDNCVIGANSFVNKDIPSNTVAMGTPVRQVGKVTIAGDDVKIEYFS